MGGEGGGDNLDKMTKNCKKIAKSAFLYYNNAEVGKSIFRVVGGDPPSPPQLGETFNIYIYREREGRLKEDYYKRRKSIYNC